MFQQVATITLFVDVTVEGFNGRGEHGIRRGEGKGYASGVGFCYLPLFAILSDEFMFSTGAAVAVFEGVVAGEPCRGDAELEVETVVEGAAGATPAAAPVPAVTAADRAFVDPPLPVESGVVAGVADPEADADAVATGPGSVAPPTTGAGGGGVSGCVAAAAATL